MKLSRRTRQDCTTGHYTDSLSVRKGINMGWRLRDARHQSRVCSTPVIFIAVNAATVNSSYMGILMGLSRSEEMKGELSSIVGTQDARIVSPFPAMRVAITIFVCLG